jgi:hypothetical protein
VQQVGTIMPKINYLTILSIFFIIYCFTLNKCQGNILCRNLVKEVNMEGGNLISRPRNLETDEISEINTGHNEIFMIKENIL